MSQPLLRRPGGALGGYIGDLGIIGRNRECDNCNRKRETFRLDAAL
jgi:hypothetical protein